MNIVFDPPELKFETGTSSFMSYHNPNFKRAMNEFFGVKNNEYITDIVIQRDGIRAYFKFKGEK